MNQRDLYASLNHAGCKIICFEDFPTQYGSWRATFMFANIVCEVNCNRGDSILSLSSKNTTQGVKTLHVQSRKLVSDQLEIGKVIDWVRTLRTSISTPQFSPQYEVV